MANIWPNMVIMSRAKPPNVSEIYLQLWHLAFPLDCHAVWHPLFFPISYDLPFIDTIEPKIKGRVRGWEKTFMRSILCIVLKYSRRPNKLRVPFNSKFFCSCLMVVFIAADLKFFSFLLGIVFSQCPSSMIHSSINWLHKDLLLSIHWSWSCFISSGTLLPFIKQYRFSSGSKVWLREKWNISTSPLCDVSDCDWLAHKG